MSYMYYFVEVSLLLFVVVWYYWCSRVKPWFGSFELDEDSKERLYELATKKLQLANPVEKDKLHISMKRDGVRTALKEPTRFVYEKPVEGAIGRLRVFPMRNGLYCLVGEVHCMWAHRDDRLAMWGDEAAPDDKLHVTLAYDVPSDFTGSTQSSCFRIQIVGESFVPMRTVPLQARLLNWYRQLTAKPRAA